MVMVQGNSVELRGQNTF